ncbi:hypothetical protein QBC46DRAFT_384506 [Diplogelasinospora grovesii]|uniref:Uncharacterized protein n=1 Tax=Diplogelasinospora grovesii TaxID=303347 RepID=A0AAN6N8G6_9PEZI|nr:hypothetical protein QBC46DRAFT_384506 [Diplogelasinospora grovesii]
MGVPIFLTLPLEIRLEVYKFLLVLPPLCSDSSSLGDPREDDDTRFGCILNRCTHPHNTTLENVGGGRKDVKTEEGLLLYPGILRVCTQIHDEAVSLLYGYNTFTTDLGDEPFAVRLRPWYDALPSSSLGVVNLPDPPGTTTTTTTTTLSRGVISSGMRNGGTRIRKWRVPLSLDHTPTTTVVVRDGFRNGPDDDDDDEKGDESKGWTKGEMTNNIFTNADELTINLTWSSSSRSPHSHRGGRSNRTAATVRACFLLCAPPSIAGLRQFEGVRGVRKVSIIGAIANGYGYDRYITWLTQQMSLPVGTGEQKYEYEDESERRRLAGWTT